MPVDPAASEVEAKHERVHAAALRSCLDVGDPDTPLVLVTLKDGRKIRGRVTSVAATNAFAVVDGWHIPLIQVEGVEKIFGAIDDEEALAA